MLLIPPNHLTLPSAILSANSAVENTLHHCNDKFQGEPCSFLRQLKLQTLNGSSEKKNQEWR